MRIKFEKGMTPEAIGRAFVEFAKENNIVIGAVNMYVQTYDDEMSAEKFKKDEEIFICSPSETTKQRYSEDMATIRRKRMKAV